MNTGHRLLPTLKSPGKHDIESSDAELLFTRSVGLSSDIQEPATSLLHISVIQLTEKRLSKVVNAAGTPDPSSSSWISCLGFLAPPESHYARLNFQSKFGHI